jgi:pyruvate dehydrogenase (quinone)
MPERHVQVIQVDLDPSRLGRRSPVDVAVAGDVGRTIEALLPRLAAKTGDHLLTTSLKETSRWHKRLQHYVESGPHTKPIRPEYLAATLSEVAADDALFFADTGTAVIWAARHISYGAHRRLFGSFSWASMANASPNAFGAQLAFRGRQTIALCGDGGFTMGALGDLLTEVEHGAQVVHVVLNNGGLDFVRIEQQEAGYVPIGTEFVNPDFAKVAEALGARGIRLEDPGDVRDGLLEALHHQGGPVVVDAVVDPYALALPAYVPGHTAMGFTLSMARQVWAGHGDDVFSTATHNAKLV